MERRFADRFYLHRKQTYKDQADEIINERILTYACKIFFLNKKTPRPRQNCGGPYSWEEISISLLHRDGWKEAIGWEVLRIDCLEQDEVEVAQLKYDEDR